MKSLPLSRGLTAWVNDEDYERLSTFKWYATTSARSNTYAARNVKHSDGRRTVVLLHREVLEAGQGVVVDHTDGDGLNNTRANLRVVVGNGNKHNVRRHVDNASGFKGVSAFGRKWRAQICCDRRTRHLGLFDTPEAAARAYDVASRELHGEFAKTNVALGLFGVDQ